MDDNKVLVFHESPQLVKDALGLGILGNEPVLSVAYLESFVRFQQVILHVYLVQRLKSSDNEGFIVGVLEKHLVQRALHRVLHKVIVKESIAVLGQRVRSLYNNWGQLIVPVADIFLFAFRLFNVGHTANSLYVALRLFLSDEMTFGSVPRVLILTEIEMLNRRLRPF